VHLALLAVQRFEAALRRLRDERAALETRARA
jgi:hypothetical protein